MSNTGNKVFGGLVWSFAERITAQLVSTVVTIVLARILDPTHYGIISLVTVFITLCNVFVTSGFGSALVQKKNADENDFNTAFLLSFTLSIILYIVVFLSAPVVSQFYNMLELTAVMRVMGLRIPLAALNSIQQAEIQREMKFKKFFIATSLGTGLSGVVGILLALQGFGVWALVTQYLTNTTANSIIFWIVGDWKPKIQFSKEKAKEIFSFGWKVLVTNLIFTTVADIRSLIIGKVYGYADLAYYDQGKKYPSLLVTNLNTAINKVMLPTYSRHQANKEKLRQMLRKSIRIGVFLLAPILIGFACVSENFVRVVLTEKWLFSVPYIQIFCLAYLTRPLETSCHQAILALGRSDLVLYIIGIINSFSLLTVLVSVFIFDSILLIAIGSLLSAIISIIGFMLTSWRLIGYTPKEQIRDVFPSLFLSAIMGLVVVGVNLIDLSPIIEIAVQIIIGAIVYIVFSHIFKLKAYVYLLNMFLSKKREILHVRRKYS